MRLDDYFRGLSDLTRLRIINLLLHEELCGCDIQQLLGIAQPLVSRHLLYLKRSGLVANRREGFRVFYHVAEGNTLRDLFVYLQRAFREHEPFEPDLARLRILLGQGHLRRDRKHKMTYDALQRKQDRKRRRRDARGAKNER